MKKIKYLSKIKSNQLFSHLTDNELLEIINHCSIKEYSKGGIIHLQKQPCNSLGIVLDGDVAIQRLDNDGRVLTIVYLKMGESFGGNLIFADQVSYPMTVSANSNSVILHIDKDTILELCQKDKTFLVEYIRSISNKAILVSNKLNTVVMKSIREKIIYYLNQEYAAQQSQRIILPFIKKDWAESLGIPRPSLSRELSKMKADNLIDYSKNWILIKWKIPDDTS